MKVNNKTCELLDREKLIAQIQKDRTDKALLAELQ
jgi:hypothetical protein